jgi:ribosomal protein S18 acetylase RimI-like enzyme
MEPDDEATVIRTLSAAFGDDPVTNWLLRQDGARADAFARFYRFLFRRFALKSDTAWITDDGLGAAIWLPPDGWHLALMAQAAVAPTMLRAVSMRRFPRLLRFSSALERAHPDEAHWFLQIIGVHPDAQRRGLGRALIQPMLDRLDETGEPAYLESSKPENVPYYRRFGFEVIDELRPGGDGPAIPLMWRAPAAPGA